MSSLEPVDLITLKAIAGHGDDKSIIRDVIHYTYFMDETDARAFAKAVLAQGFHDVSLGQPGTEDGDEGYVIRAHHDGTLNESDIGERLTTMRALAKTYSGDYDGWEAALALAE